MDVQQQHGTRTRLLFPAPRKQLRVKRVRRPNDRTVSENGDVFTCWSPQSVTYIVGRNLIQRKTGCGRILFSAFFCPTFDDSVCVCVCVCVAKRFEDWLNVFVTDCVEFQLLLQRQKRRRLQYVCSEGRFRVHAIPKTECSRLVRVQQRSIPGARTTKMLVMSCFFLRVVCKSKYTRFFFSLLLEDNASLH